MTDSHATFELYDLTVRVERIDGHCTCAMTLGDCFYVRGGKLSLPDGKDFCIYALNSTLPLIPIRQRHNHPADWIETDAVVACPDPACGLVMRLERTATRTLHHDDVSATKLSDS